MSIQASFSKSRLVKLISCISASHLLKNNNDNQLFINPVDKAATLKYNKFLLVIFL